MEWWKGEEPAGRIISPPRRSTYASPDQMLTDLTVWGGANNDLPATEKGKNIAAPNMETAKVGHMQEK